MKKSRAILLAAAVCAALTGCGGQDKTGVWGADENSIYVNRALEIESAMIYTSEKDNDTYSQDELQAFAEEAVIDYNTAAGGTASAQNTDGAERLPVALKSCKLEGRTGTLVFEYAGGDDFVKFAQESGDNTHTVTLLSAEKVTDALAAGELTDKVLVNAEGKPAPADEVAKMTAGGVVTVEGAATVCTEGKVLYRSEGVELRDSYTAVTPEGESYIIFK